MIIELLKPYIQLSPLNETEVREIVAQSPSKHSILDPLPRTLLKKNIEYLIKPITILINKSLTTGNFPNKWKTAVITPLLKKQNLSLELKNYRPVSNLPFLSKILEKAALQKLTTHFSLLDQFATSNSAYKAYYSTETLLTKISSDILTNMENKKTTLLVMLDLSAAFDTVKIKTLIDIFEFKYNINGLSLQRIISYLT